MPKILRQFNFLWALLFLASCGGTTDSSMGGAEAGNPPAPTTRLVIGQVAPSEDNSCLVDTIVATDSQNQSQSSSLESDCTFSIDLITGYAYTLSFENGGEFAGLLLFSIDSSFFPTSYLFVFEGEDPIDLGELTFEGTTVTAENQPDTQNDQDADGVTDAEDTDDNNDGTADVDETDCDLDGLWDIYDSDMSTCESEEENQGSDQTDGEEQGEEEEEGTEEPEPEGQPEEEDEEEITGKVLEVTPRNLAGIITVTTAVDLDNIVAARTSCEIDASSVNALTFSVVAAEGQALNCFYEVVSTPNIISCYHDEEPFLLLTTYLATINGVKCIDGGLVEVTSWSWMTLF